MSVPIRVKLYKDNEKVDYPERFMTLSYNIGIDPKNNRMEYGNEVIKQVIEVMSSDYAKLPYPDFNIIEVHYYSNKITKYMDSSLLKFE
jgi:hypothetical protein